jgi:hypothetical protein
VSVPDVIEDLRIVVVFESPAAMGFHQFFDAIPINVSEYQTDGAWIITIAHIVHGDGVGNANQRSVGLEDPDDFAGRGRSIRGFEEQDVPVQALQMDFPKPAGLAVVVEAGLTPGVIDRPGTVPTSP